MLIKESGCENYKEGDATISKKHSKFFINDGNAKSSDIERLNKKVKKKKARYQNIIEKKI